MEKLKKGDIVELETDINMHFPKGINMTVFYVNKDYIELCTSLKAKTYNVKKIGESQMQYEESNRYKLAQAIQKTGISAKALSRAVVGNESYFYNKTGVARFNKKGDISDDVLNLALVDLAFAEREVLGIGAKAVEEPNKETIDAIDAECDSDVFLIAQDLANSVKEKPTSNTNHDDHVDALSYGFIGTEFKEKPTSSKPLFIGAAVVIFIAIILFILNNYLQVV